MAPKKNQHATKSFDEMVASVQTKQMDKVIEAKVMQLGQQLLPAVYNMIIRERAAMQTRQLAFERLLKANAPWFNDDVLALAVADVEDESEGRKPTDEPAQAGDKVRLELWGQPADAAGYGEVQKLAIQGLMVRNPQNNAVQTDERLEEQLVGLKVGDVKEFLVPEPVAEGQEPEYTKLKVSIMRVSRQGVANAA